MRRKAKFLRQWEPQRARPAQRGQAAIEIIFVVPLLMLFMFGAFQLARVFYLYHTVQKALRGGIGVLARASSVNYCDAGDPTIAYATSLMVNGNLDAGQLPGQGDTTVQGLTTDMINIIPERATSGSPAPCTCGGDVDSCDITNGGRAPDFVVVNDLGGGILGYPVNVLFPYVNTGLGIVYLPVSVRMAVTGN